MNPMDETFPLLLQTALQFQETRCRDELLHYIRVDEQAELISYSRGCLQSIARMRGCQDPLAFMILLLEQSCEVTRHSPPVVDADHPMDKRANLTYLWHLGQYVQIEFVAKLLKLHERHKNG